MGLGQVSELWSGLGFRLEIKVGVSRSGLSLVSMSKLGFGTRLNVGFRGWGQVSRRDLGLDFRTVIGIGFWEEGRGRVSRQELRSRLGFEVGDQGKVSGQDGVRFPVETHCRVK